MEELLYQVDATLAALSDAEIETRWRQALADDERGLVFVCARQLVLRMLPVIEQTVAVHARTAALERRQCTRLIEESAIKLLLRLLHDAGWRSLPGLAAAITQRASAAPYPPHQPVWFVQRPRLRLLENQSHDRQRHGGGDER